VPNDLRPLINASLAALNGGLRDLVRTAHEDDFDPLRLTRRRRLIEGACLAIVVRAALRDHWGGKATSVDDAHRDLKSLIPGSFSVFCLEESSDAVLALERLLVVVNEHNVGLADVAALREFLHSLDIVRTGSGWQLDPGEDARKRLGAFYTPATLARAIVRQAIDRTPRTAGDHESLSVADASVGAGEFLLAALEELASVDPSTDRWDLASNAVGLDVDPLATELAMLRVAHWAGALERVASLRANFVVGNPVLPSDCGMAPQETRWNLALVDRYWAPSMGLLGHGPLSRRFDLVVGNPPWEKLRVEERRFFAPYSPSIANATNKRERLQAILSRRQLMPALFGYFDLIQGDVERARTQIRNEPQLSLGARGELMTAPLFTALALSQLADDGALALLVKSSVLTSRPLLGLAAAVADLGEVTLFEFVNRKGLFPIDSRERFTAIVARQERPVSLEVATGLVSADEVVTAKRAQISPSLRQSMSDVGLPLIGDADDVALLSRLVDRSPQLISQYPDARFGRIVHLTSHAEQLSLEREEGWIPVLEGKMIWRYDGRYASFEGVSHELRKRPKAMAREVPTDDKRDRAYVPERRWFIDPDAWGGLTKHHSSPFSLYWRNTTSASNTRAVVATVLPHQPSTQSLQLLQLPRHGPQELGLLLAVMNSSVFEWVVRRFMTGIDLTSSIVSRVPVPELESWNRPTPAGSSLKAAVLSRVGALLRPDVALDKFVASLPGAALPAFEGSEREVLEAEIDVLVAEAYGLGGELSRVISDLPHTTQGAVREANARLNMSDVA
jgi:hypothetical protein